MSFKQQQYDQYVSSGQAGVPVDNNPDVQFARRRPYFKRTFEKHLRERDPNSRIVDLGCGNGGWLYFLKKYGYSNVAGVDISAEQVEFAHNLGISEVSLGDLDSFIDSQSGVDVVLLMDILEHFPIEESDRLLRRIAKMMNPDAKLIIHVPNGEGLFGQRIRYGDLTHETCFTPKSIHQLLSPIGFCRIRCFEDRPIVHGVKSAIRRLIWDTGTLFPRLLLLAETGSVRCILSQNMTVTATIGHELR